MTSLIPGSVTVQQGVLTGAAQTDTGRILYIQVATTDFTETQRHQPIADVVVAMVDALVVGEPTPATIALDSQDQAEDPDLVAARRARIGQPVSPQRREAIEAILAKLEA